MIDAVVAVAAFALSAAVLVGPTRSPRLREPDVAAYVLVAVYSASPIVRRWAPVVALFRSRNWGCVRGSAVSGGVDSGRVAGDFHGGRGARAATSPAAVGGRGGVRRRRCDGEPGPDHVRVPALIVSAWLLGNYVGSRPPTSAELEDKNRLLEQARIELADRAVTDERLRIARSCTTWWPTRSAWAPFTPAPVVWSLTTTRSWPARRWRRSRRRPTRRWWEMRRMLGVLRGADSEQPGIRAPPPASETSRVGGRRRASGVTVEMRVEGERKIVPAGVGRSIERVEATTAGIRAAVSAFSRTRPMGNVARRLADDIVKMPPVAEGVTLLERLVDERRPLTA